MTPFFVTPALFAALSPHPTWIELLIFQLNGLVVVFIALGSIWGAVEIVGYFFKRGAAASTAGISPPAVAPAGAAVSTPPAQGAEGIDPQTIVVIAAAVHATLGARYRVRAITTGDMNIEWAQEGRRQIFASHKVR